MTGSALLRDGAPAGQSAVEARADAAEARDRYVVPGLERGLRMMEELARRGAPMGLSELARSLGVNRSTAYRLACTLEGMGYVVREPNGKGYRLGTRVLGLGFTFLNSLELVDLARPHLEKLRDDTGTSAHLAIREGREIVYVSRVASTHHLTSNVTVGTRLPAHATSMGRILLMDRPEAEIRSLYADAALPAFTGFTPTTVDRLVAVLAEDRARGHVVSRSSFEAGIASIAAPVRDAEGRVIAALSVVGADTILDPPEREADLVRATVAAADQVSLWLGHRPGVPVTPDDPPPDRQKDRFP
jgi:DNA-binding IclR family transcriptional regulator